MMPSNGQLRTYQILVFVISGTAGLVVSISIGWTSRILGGKCVLFSNMALSSYGNGSLALLPSSTTYGKTLECEFSTFCPVGVTIYCVIWIWFYIFLSDWGTSFIEDEPLIKEDSVDRSPTSPPADQHLLVPSIVCNTAVLGLLLGTVAIVEAGRSEWCEFITTQLSDKSCDHVGTTTWLNLPSGSSLYGYLSHARIACWVLLFSMVIQTLLIFIRLRRNSQRSEIHTLPSFEEPWSDTEPLSGSDYPDLDSSILDNRPLDDTQQSSSLDDSRTSQEEAKPPTRRRLQRQKKVIIDVGDLDEGVPGQTTGLLHNIDEYMEAPS